jgi:hypothetical protein
MDSHVGECKVKNKHSQDIRVEKDLLPTAGKECMKLFPNQCLLQQSRCGYFIQGATHIHTGARTFLSTLAVGHGSRRKDVRHSLGPAYLTVMELMLERLKMANRTLGACSACVVKMAD